MAESEHFAYADGRKVFMRNRLEPGDLGRVVSFHGEVYGREHGLGPIFEGYVAKTVGEFAAELPGAAGQSLAQDDGAAESRAPLAASRAGKNDRIWLLSVEKEVDLVGSCAVIDRGDRLGQFRWFLVDPAYRGFGLGKRLLELALAFAKGSGYREIFLSTGDFLAPAARLYRKMGFQLEKEIYTELWEIPFHEQFYRLIFDEPK